MVTIIIVIISNFDLFPSNDYEISADVYRYTGKTCTILLIASPAFRD